MEELIRSTGFFRNKAKSLQGASALICQDFGGEVPREMDALISLPGVARKTANVVRGVCFGLADGIVVDTHVKRLSQRLGLTQQKTPEKIEKELMALIPRRGLDRHLPSVDLPRAAGVHCAQAGLRQLQPWPTCARRLNSVSEQ